MYIICHRQIAIYASDAPLQQALLEMNIVDVIKKFAMIMEIMVSSGDRSYEICQTWASLQLSTEYFCVFQIRV